MEIDAEHKLLEKGSKCYVGALNALAEFRRVVQTKCGTVFTKQRLQEHNSKLRIEDKKLKIEESGSKEKYWDQKETWLGLIIRIPNTYDSLSYGLSWLKNGEVHAFANIWLYNDETRRALAAALDKANQKLEEDQHEFYLSKIVPDGEITTFERVLEEVVCQWMQVWDKIGGYPALAVAK